MATNDELAARYPDLVGDDAEADRELVETVRALDALYAARAPEGLNARVARIAAERAVTRASVSTRPVRREVDNVRMVTRAKGWRWTGLAATVAACVVVGLLAALLIGERGGGTAAMGGGQSFAQQGGVRIVALTACREKVGGNGTATCPLQRAMPGEGTILKHRLADVLGVRNATVRVANTVELVIEMPGVTDTRAALPLVAQGSFDILDTGATYLAPGTRVDAQGAGYQVVLQGSQVDPASVSTGADRQTGQPIVTFAFAGTARQQFAQYTQGHIGQYLTIAVDGVVIESATIQSAIDGEAQVAGFASANEARQVAAFLKYGPLAVPLKVIAVELVLPGGSVSCATPAGTPLPVSTPTAPPDSTPVPPTPTPWPNPTPIWTPAQTPDPGSNGSVSVVQLPPMMDCATATSGVGGLPTPTQLPGR